MQLNCSSATAEAVATETAVLLLKQLSSNWRKKEHLIKDKIPNYISSMQIW
jgi:hypothetical protein